MADLTTLLREAAPVPGAGVDVDAVVRRGAALRRRRAAASGAAALALVAVAAAGMSTLVPRPVAPVIGSEPDVDALVELVPVRVDATGLHHEAAFDAADLPTTLPGEGLLVPGVVLAVGSDGTAVVVDRAGATQLVEPGGRLRTVLPLRGWRAAVVLPDSSVVGAVEPLEGMPARVVRVAASPGFEVVDLGLDVAEGEVFDPGFVLDADGALRLVVETAAGLQTVVVPIADARLAAPRSLGPPDPGRTWRDAPWGVVVDSNEDGILVTPTSGIDVLLRYRAAAGDGLRSWTEPRTVLDGRSVVALQRTLAGGPDAGLGTIGVVLGPARGDVTVVPVVTSDGGAITSLHLSTDGALWAHDETAGRLHLLAPVGALPDGSTRALPATPQRTGSGGGGVVVAGPGETLPPTDMVLQGEQVGTVTCSRATSNPLGDCTASSVVSVAPDGTAAVFDAAGDLEVTAGQGVVTVGVGQLWGHALPGFEGRDPLRATFDASGNLWALADRWWSGASFPDLVVRRPGEDGFTSLGHVRVGDLLGAGADEVLLHVQDDDVALFGPSGRRVEVVRAGVVTTAQQRAASVALVAGVSQLVGSGGAMGVSSSPLFAADTMGRLSGPFVGTDALVGTILDLTPDSQTRLFPRDDLTGGVVVLTDVDAGDLYLADSAGVAAQLHLGVGHDDLLAVRVAADGSVWQTAGGRIVQLLDAAWRPVAP